MNGTVALVSTVAVCTGVVRVRTALAAAAGAKRVARLHADVAGACGHCTALTQRRIGWPCVTAAALHGDGDGDG